jgi:MOSC domain-containing protein YiiM
MGTIKAVCTSDRKGIQKEARDGVEIREDWGIADDAHAGKWHRQVSLLSYESIEAFKARGAEVVDGSFGENLVVEGFDLKALPLGTRFTTSGGVELELTQIGKECHSHCAIYYTMGECIMPHEGVFTRVLRGGHVAPGDTIEITHEPTAEETEAVVRYAAACVAAQKGAPFVA